MKTGQDKKDKVKKVKDKVDKGIMKTLMFMEKGIKESNYSIGSTKRKCIKLLTTGEVIRVDGAAAEKAVAANQATYASKEEWKKGGRK